MQEKGGILQTGGTPRSDRPFSHITELSGGIGQKPFAEGTQDRGSLRMQGRRVQDDHSSLREGRLRNDFLFAI